MPFVFLYHFPLDKHKKGKYYRTNKIKLKRKMIEFFDEIKILGRSKLLK